MNETPNTHEQPEQQPGRFFNRDTVAEMVNTTLLARRGEAFRWSPNGYEILRFYGGNWLVKWTIAFDQLELYARELGVLKKGQAIASPESED